MTPHLITCGCRIRYASGPTILAALLALTTSAPGETIQPAMAIFDRFMLRIAHGRLDAEVPPAAEFPIDVMIDDRSEAGLQTDELPVRWRREGETEWQSIPLAPAAGVDSFRAAGAYWITVHSENGSSTGRCLLVR